MRLPWIGDSPWGGSLTQISPQTPGNKGFSGSPALPPGSHGWEPQPEPEENSDNANGEDQGSGDVQAENPSYSAFLAAR